MIQKGVSSLNESEVLIITPHSNYIYSLEKNTFEEIVVEKSKRIEFSMKTKSKQFEDILSDIKSFSL